MTLDRIHKLTGKVEARQLVILSVTTILLLGGSATLFAGYLVNNSPSCFENKTEVRSLPVSGDSMTPTLRPGENITARLGHYRCRNVSRNDMVVYLWSGQPETPLVKYVKALPDDNVSISGCNVMVNGEKMRNDQGTPYCLDQSGRDRIVKAEETEEGYLLMGNRRTGSLDSSLFGYAVKGRLIGKAYTNKTREELGSEGLIPWF